MLLCAVSLLSHFSTLMYIAGNASSVCMAQLPWEVTCDTLFLRQCVGVCQKLHSISRVLQPGPGHSLRAVSLLPLVDTTLGSWLVLILLHVVLGLFRDLFFSIYSPHYSHYIAFYSIPIVFPFFVRFLD